MQNELVLSTPTRRGGGAEIPTPNFEVVDSYERGYTRTFNQPPSYLRGRGARSEATEYVEYDLDDGDEDWLQQLNAERRILSPERFEWMLYNMELLDHKSRERTGGMPIIQGVHMPVLLHRDVAFGALRVQTTRYAVLDAVYEYWKAKRDRWQKPILRRLQVIGSSLSERRSQNEAVVGFVSCKRREPPPPVNDTNPFNVFRPREKVHRPHTRRMQRRENDISSFEKLRQVRRNLEQSRNLILALQKREEKKCELVECEANLQRVQIRLKHDSHVGDDGLMATNSSMFTPGKFPPLKRGNAGHNLVAQWPNFGMGAANQINGHDGLEQPPLELSTPVSDVMLEDQVDLLKHKRKRKRKRLPLTRGRPMRRMKVLDSLEPILLFTKPLDAEKLAAAGILSHMEPSLENGFMAASCGFHGRIGRGGRIVFDRWNPLTRTSIGSPISSVASPPSMFPPGERFHAPPPLRLGIETSTNLKSATVAVVERNLSTDELP